MTSIDAYEAAIEVMFEDRSYGLSKGYILWIFTRSLMEMQEHIAPQIATVYNRFVHENFHPFDVCNLTL
jgi:hypothetical protein